MVYLSGAVKRSAIGVSVASKRDTRERNPGPRFDGWVPGLIKAVDGRIVDSLGFRLGSVAVDATTEVDGVRRDLFF